MNGDSCPFETGAGTTVTAPAPEAGAEDVLSQYGVVIVLVILVAAVVVLNHVGTE